MSASSLIQSAGFSVGLTVGGDSVTYVKNGNVNIPNVTCLINKAVVRGRDFFAQLKDVPADFDILGATEIEIKFSDLSLAQIQAGVNTPPKPASGEYFVEVDKRHRIRMVIATDISWIAFCTPSQL